LRLALLFVRDFDMLPDFNILLLGLELLLSLMSCSKRELFLLEFFSALSFEQLDLREWIYSIILPKLLSLLLSPLRSQNL